MGGSRPADLAGDDRTLDVSASYKSADDGHPVFCLRYIHGKHGLKNKKLSTKDKAQMLDRLHALSQLTWEEVRQQDRHAYGAEKMSFDSLKAGKPDLMPGAIAEADAFHDVLVFRRNSNKNVFAGVRVSNTLHILYIEAKFGDLYNH
ncbi:hypothetical protein [Demequina sp.]|uniref:hypothetical protein n=1 Tax=Demequina sp. TaxID=2050685 RepID=UPI003A8777AD